MVQLRVEVDYRVGLGFTLSAHPRRMKENILIVELVLAMTGAADRNGA